MAFGLGSIASILNPATALFGAGVNALVSPYLDAGKARKKAEEDAARQREALAALIAKPAAKMPSPDDAAIAAARRRSIAAMLLRHGRASTILSDTGSQGDALGA